MFPFSEEKPTWILTSWLFLFFFLLLLLLLFTFCCLAIKETVDWFHANYATARKWRKKENLKKFFSVHFSVVCNQKVNGTSSVVNLIQNYITVHLSKIRNSGRRRTTSKLTNVKRISFSMRGSRRTIKKIISAFFLSFFLRVSWRSWCWKKYSIWWSLLSSRWPRWFTHTTK